MAYCKACGNPVKEDEETCPVCGAKVETLEEIDESQVEIVRQPKTRRAKISFRAEGYSEELRDRTFSVFDRKVICCLLATLLFMALGFFVRIVDAKAWNPIEIVDALLFCILIGSIMIPAVLRNRGLLMIGLLVASAALLADTVKVFVLFDRSGVVGILRSLALVLVDLSFLTECLLLFTEMLTGSRRFLGAHCAMVVTVSVFLLATIILGLLHTPTNDLGVLVAVWQVMSVFSRITALCIIIFLFSNLGKIGLDTTY